MTARAVVSHRGAARWRGGHPWIYRSDVRAEPEPRAPGVVRVADERGEEIGQALYSPISEIRLRMLDGPGATIDAEWWTARVRAAAGRRSGIAATAYRVIHAEGDGLPSLVADRYGPVLSVQLLSAGLEARRSHVVDALEAVLEPGGILLRNDVPIREREQLAREIEQVRGTVPDTVEVEADGVRWLVDVRDGQKTGGFLDQRENQWLAGTLARGRGLDLFCYEGGFALRMAAGCDSVLAVDQSERALERVAENAALNDLGNIETRAGNAFDVLRELHDGGSRFETIVLDPPAFAKTRKSLGRALAGYKDLNMRALGALAGDGHLLTFSCSYHVSRSAFEDMLREAAADAGRRVVLVGRLGAASDHPAVLTIPETAYLKGAILRVT
ncbi:MAG: class I SAM-dependent rRNA methyltransferase [Gemmatimonadota bacterium]|nr:class I SAM-dependent rRNA methyltransferase [Gemmatimonadota bacterium]